MLAGFLELPTHHVLLYRFNTIAVIIAFGAFFVSFLAFMSCSLLHFKGRRLDSYLPTNATNAATTQ
jgi:hypothetical protein